jgi:methylated-DNA-[protein]-cysteine S-methyltransferase
MAKSYVIFRVQPGWMGLVGAAKGVQRIYLPGLEKERLRQEILKEFPGARRGGLFLKRAQKELTEYFSGRRIRFAIPLDLDEATPFQKKVYRTMVKIPFGEVRSYRWLAQRIGDPKALRAVGGANAQNRWPVVIPCHRIVGSDGRLTGFSAPGGLSLKAALLKLEGIPVQKGRVAMEGSGNARPVHPSLGPTAAR